MDWQESKLYDLDLEVKVTQNVAQYHPHHVTYALVNFEVAMSNGSGVDSFTRKYFIWPWGIWPWPKGHMKCCLVPSTSCDLCTGKIWSWYCQNIMKRCVFKKIHYLTLTLRLRSHEASPSTLDIMWPMHRQNLKLLLRKVYEEMHLQENTLFDLWPWPWGQGHTKCHPVPSTSCDLCTYKVWSRYVQRFRRRYNYKKRDGRTDRQTHGRTEDGPTLVRN